MKSFRLMSIAALCAAFTGLGWNALVASQRTVPPQPATAQAAASGVIELVYARPFTLDKPYAHAWRKDGTTYDAGWLLVLQVDPKLVEPRQTAEPVLFAGNQTLARINHGSESGRVVAVLPAPRGSDAGVALDLARTPIWFGAAELPERLDARGIQLELESALARGVQPLPAERVAAAIAAGGSLAELASREDLDTLAAELIILHAPEELDLALGLTAPRVR